MDALGVHVGARVDELPDDRVMVSERRPHQGGVSKPAARRGTAGGGEPRPAVHPRIGYPQSPIPLHGGMAGVPGGSLIGFFKTPEMPTKRGLGRVLAYSVSTGIPPAAGAAKQECDNGGREKAAVKTNRRTNKAEIRIEGWEGVPVYNAKEVPEIASLGGIVQELLHRTM